MPLYERAIRREKKSQNPITPRGKSLLLELDRSSSIT